MIKKEDYQRINREVIESIDTALDKLHELDFGNYILFLADAEYKEMPNLEPYVLDDRISSIKDYDRILFLTQFLDKYYSFPESQNSVENDLYQMNLELMIYTHLWESDFFLKKLYRLTNLLDGNEYAWKVTVPRMAKHNFIREDIREVLEKNNFELSKVIKNGFSSSLRNAFAHSQYSFDTYNGHERIYLHNYGGKTWEINDISFNKWRRRFSYSVLLGYNFLNIVLKRRKNLDEEIPFIVKIPSKDNKFKEVRIKYSKNDNSFSVIKN